MDVVVIAPPDHVIAARQRLGLDNHDEVWDGEYHMVPAGSGEHQRTIFRLAMALDPLADAAGLLLRHEWNLIPADEPGWHEVRVPDLVVCSPEHATERAAIGPASLVVEIRSPGDESFLKLPYYERLGVGEVLIIDRDTKAIRHWRLADGALVESTGEAGRHSLGCLPAELWTDGDTLMVATPDGTTRI